jgi:hypothetical protein
LAFDWGWWLIAGSGLKEALIPQNVASGLHRLPRFLKYFGQIIREVQSRVEGRGALHNNH